MHHSCSILYILLRTLQNQYEFHPTEEFNKTQAYQYFSSTSVFPEYVLLMNFEFLFFNNNCLRLFSLHKISFAGKGTAGLLAQAVENQTCLFFISITPSATDRKEEIKTEEERSLFQKERCSLRLW